MKPAQQDLQLAGALLGWYQEHKRPLPWRSRPEPYAIWLAEIMLQQTRMETAVPRWRSFLARFPTIEALAAASVHDVCDEWAGLGYYSRARNLHKAAALLVSAHGGQLPADAAALGRLPGIGPYTAGAIASIAFGVPAALVDGNVERVLARLGRMAHPYQTAAGKRLFWQRAQRLVEAAASVGKPGDFNQGLMELGSTVCLPRSPRCGVCPLQSMCQAARAGDPQAFPVKQAKKPPTRLTVVFVLHRQHTGLLLIRRPMNGLWAGLWEPPSAVGLPSPTSEPGAAELPVSPSPRALRAGQAARAQRAVASPAPAAADAEAHGKLLLEQRGYSLGKKLGEVEHVLTHRRVTAHVYESDLSAAPESAPAELRAFVADLQAWPMSRLAQKVVALAEPRAGRRAAGKAAEGAAERSGAA